MCLNIIADVKKYFMEETTHLSLKMVNVTFLSQQFHFFDMVSFCDKCVFSAIIHYALNHAKVKYFAYLSNIFHTIVSVTPLQS